MEGRTSTTKNIFTQPLRQLAAVACWLLATLALPAQTYPEKPNPPRLVNDLVGMLSAAERQALEQKLVAYNDTTSTQITIVALQTVNGADMAQYATELGEKWGVGQAATDNGVLVLIALTDRKIFIATGRGAEPYLPDAICKRIIERLIKPAFRTGNYYDGLNDATTEMMARLSGNFTAEDDVEKPLPFWAIALIIFLIVLVIIVANAAKSGNRTTFGRGGYGSIGGGTIWHTGSRTWGGGGSSWGRGGGGGGFGGFGGGSFGGGGAGGSW